MRDNETLKFHKIMLTESHEDIQLKNKIVTNLSSLNSAFNENQYDANNDSEYEEYLELKKAVLNIENGVVCDFSILDNMKYLTENDVDENGDLYYPYTIKINDKNNTEFFIEKEGVYLLEQILKDVDLEKYKNKYHDRTYIDWSNKLNVDDDYNRFSITIYPNKDNINWKDLEDNFYKLYKGKNDFKDICITDFSKSDGYVVIMGYMNGKNDLKDNFSDKYGRFDVDLFLNMGVEKENLNKIIKKITHLFKENVSHYKNDFNYDLNKIYLNRTSEYIFLTRINGTGLLPLGSKLGYNINPNLSVEYFIDHKDFNGVYYLDINTGKVKDITNKAFDLLPKIVKYNEFVSEKYINKDKLDRINDQIKEIKSVVNKNNERGI